MRIEVVTSLYPSPPRPFEGIFAERRWTGMAARGHDVRVLHPQPLTVWPFLRGRYGEIHAMPRHEHRAGIPIGRPRYLHLPGRARGNARRFARCALARLGPCDVVVCDYAWPAAALAPLLAARAGAPPCVINGRGSDVLEVAGEADLAAPLAEGLRAAGHWCAVSGDLVAAMDRVAGRPGHGRLAPNGVDTDLFRPGDRDGARASLGLTSGGALGQVLGAEGRAPLVLVVGHLIERKDPLLALEAFRRGAPGDARLVFVGRGPLEADVHAAVEAAGLTGRVHLVGERPPAELSTWYAACDLLLLTSRREGRPNVVLEALASGRPVLATAAGGTAEVVTDDRMLAPDRAPEAVATRLRALLAAPPTAEEARALATLWSWTAGLDALEDLLQEVRVP